MTRDEFATWSMLLKTAYPRESLLPNKQAVEMWYRMLCHIPYNVAEAVLQKWLGTHKWPPTIAEILEESSQLMGETPPDWSEGWLEVQKAFGKFGIYDSKRALESMSPITAETVRRLGWTNLCLSVNHEADRASFRHCYEIMCKREKEDRQLPPGLKQLLGKIGEHYGNLSLPDSGKTYHEKELPADSLQQEA